ncbi:hypothetical protein ACFQE2_00550 [Methylophaga thalassica]|uniref:hypothetical protein n=1 Tax=Methylophaga thalassica TaxID=40223 RepID=UPI00361C7E16
MTQPTHSDFHQRLASYDDEIINSTEQKSLDKMVLSRRDVLKGSLNAAVIGFLGLNMGSRFAFAGENAIPLPLILVFSLFSHVPIPYLMKWWSQMAIRQKPSSPGVIRWKQEQQNGKPMPVIPGRNS